MNINLKKVISSVAALAMSLSCFTAFAADFTDVEATASYKTAIDELVALEIVNGYEDGSFKPENEITRAEVTKMVVAAMGDSYTAAAESSKGTSGFADVDAANHWASGFISVGVAQKFINGMGDGTFAPDSNVTYAQIVKMLVAALGYDSAAALAGGYPNGYLQIGAQIGVTAGVTGLGADTAVTRAHVAQLISNALDTPLVVVTGWSQNYVTGEPIAETDVMDGTEGKAYKTLLTENHNAYVVKGRVTGTFATAGADAGMVEFTIEYADNYDGEEISVKDGDDAVSVDAFFGDTNAEDLLFTYAEAIIQLDENDDATILSITPYGRNEIVDVDADLFAADSYAAAGEGSAVQLTELKFYKSETSTKTNNYAIDKFVKLYVNGILLADGSEGLGFITAASEMVADYIAANQIGDITLINSPDAGQTSLDKDFDVIMITLPKWAIVEETVVSGDINKIIFDEYENGVGASISIDTTDDEKVYNFFKNGEEIAFEDIAAGDVVLLTFDLADKANESDFVTFEFCDTVVEGLVTGKSSDGKFTVNGEQYSLYEGSLELNYEYSLKLDAAGRVVKAEEITSAKNYGIIDRVSYSQAEDAYVARIIKADATRENVVIKSTGVLKDNAASKAFDLFNEVYDVEPDVFDGEGVRTEDNSALNENDDIKTADESLKAVQNRIVSYKINSKGELNAVEFEDTAAEIGMSGVEYKESSMKLGSYRISDSTVIIDATQVTPANINDSAAYTAANFVASSLDMFADGEEYKFVVADKVNNTYKFALVLYGNTSINLTTGFAVVDSVDKEVDDADGEVKQTITVLDANSNGELVTYFVDEDLDIPDLARGTVVALGVKGDVVVAYEVLFDGFAVTDEETAPVLGGLTYTEAATIFSDLGAGNAIYSDSRDAFWVDSPVDEAWDNTTTATPNGWARTGFGMIINKNGSTITLAQNVDETENDIFDKNGDDLTWVATTDSQEFDLDADVNVYVVNANYLDKSGTDRISAGSASSIEKTASVKEVQSYTRSGESPDYVYTAAAEVLDLTNVEGGLANYAYFKVVDGDITDIVVFIPAN